MSEQDTKKPIHGFDGMWSPKHGKSDGQTTFSLGVFEILPAKDGKGTKRGKVKVRVRGYVNDVDRTYLVAKVIADQLDAGVYYGPKLVKAWLYAV